VRKPPKNPPQITISWGRGASAWRPGLLIKKHFREHPETCCADAYYSLSQHIEELNRERVQIGEKPFRRPNYSSFYQASIDSLIIFLRAEIVYEKSFFVNHIRSQIFAADEIKPIVYK